MKTISYKRYGKILFQKVAQGHKLPFVQPGSPQHALKHMCSHKYLENLIFIEILTQQVCQKYIKIVTKTISYKRYGEILFQKVASGPELPLVQPGSPKNALKQFIFHKYIKTPKILKFSLYKLPINRPGRLLC